MESIEGRELERFGFYSVLPEDKGVLAENDTPKVLKEHYGVTMTGVQRSVFHQTLIDAAEKVGVTVHWGHKLVSFDQRDDAVTVKFENGHDETVSFVLGCDGLHSNTRICLFGAEKADFTGLVQVIHCLGWVIT